MAGGDDKPDLGQTLSQYGSMSNGKGRLVLPDGQGKKLAGVVADVLAAVKAVRKEATDAKLGAPTDISSLPQSKYLTEKFARRGKELDDILAEQEKALTDLGEAFVLVDKTYKGTDQSSGDAFKNEHLNKANGNKYHIDEKKFKYGPLGIDLGRNWQDPYLGDNPKNKDMKVEDKYKDKPLSGDQAKEYQQRGFERDTQTVSPEPGMSIGWKDEMKNFGTSAYDAASKNVFVAWNWCRLSTELTRAFNDLSGRMSEYSKNWEGQGKEAAEKATTNYAASTQPLTQYMDQLGRTLNYLCGEMSRTAQDIQSAVSNVDPAHPSKDGDTLDKVSDDVAQRVAASIMDSQYSPAIKAADGSLFSLPDPTKPLSGKPLTNTPPANTPPANTPPGSTPPGGTPPGATPTSSRTPSGNNGSTEQQRQEQERQRKANAEYQKQLEQQRQEDQKRAEEERQRQVAAQKQQQQAAEQQAAQQATQQAMSQAQQAAQQGMQALQQAIQQGAQAFQQDEAAKRMAGLPSPAGLGESALEAAKKAGGAGGGGRGGGVGAGGGAGTGGGPRDSLQASRLFPRASVSPETAALSATRSGIAAGPAAGAPGGMGPAGHGAGGQGQNKEHKRADFLDSTENLEEALGDAPVVAKPVVEQ